MPPPIAPRTQVWRPRAPVGRQRRRHLVDPIVGKRRAYDHLARELHPRRPQVQRPHAIAIEPAQAAVKVAGAHAKEQPPQKTQTRIAQIAVQRRHGAARDPALEAIAHHDVGACAQPFHKRHQLGEVVGIVGIAHDDEPPARRRYAADQRRAIAAFGNGGHARAVRLGDRLRSVAAAVVGNQHLALDAAGRQEPARFVDAARDRLSLIEARHQDREFKNAFAHTANRAAKGRRTMNPPSPQGRASIAHGPRRRLGRARGNPHGSGGADPRVEPRRPGHRLARLRQHRREGVQDVRHMRPNLQLCRAHGTLHR